MSIKDLFLKIKVWGSNSAFMFKHKAESAFRADFFTAIIIILVAFIGFGLGKLSALEGKKAPILIEKNQFLLYQSNEIISGEKINSIKTIKNSPDLSGKKFVASKSGTKYYLPWCGTVSRIKEENKIWFATEAEARKAGYAPAENCAGLK